MHLFRQCLSTWNVAQDGRPKIHFASQAPDGPKGAHADGIDREAFIRFMRLTGDLDFDIVFECKNKEISVLAMRECLREGMEKRISHRDTLNYYCHLLR